MPAKFKESTKVLVNRATKKYKTVNYYLRSTPTEDIQKALDNGNAKPKHKQSWRNELVRRNAL